MGKRFLTALGAVLYAAALFWNLNAREGLNRTYVRLTQQTLPIPISEEASICLWGRVPSQEVSCFVTGRTAQVTRIALWGNPGLLDLDALAWQAGGYVDEQTALSLFGTTQCAAQRLQWQGEEYVVLGTVASLEPVLVTMARETDTLTMGVLPIPAERGSFEGSQLLAQLGLSGQVLDGYTLWTLSRNLLLVLPALLLGRWSKRAGTLRWIPIALLLWQFAVVPSGMIPSRWSDFAFWGRWWESQWENIALLLHTPLGSTQLQMLLDVVKSIAAAITASLLVM